MTPTDHGIEGNTASRDGVTATSVRAAPSLPAGAADPVALGLVERTINRLNPSGGLIRVSVPAMDLVLTDALSEAAGRAGNPATDHVDLSPTTAGSAEGVKLDLSAPPFAETGVGGLMFSGAHAYRAEYVLSTEGDDHQPTEFEAWLLEDFVSGLMSDERFFGPVRALLALASRAPTQTGEGQ